MREGNNQKTVAIVLAVLLVLAVGYISVTKYNEAKEREQLGVLQQGFQIGYQQAASDLLKGAETCQPVPVTTGNTTSFVMLVGCDPNGYVLANQQLFAALQQQAQQQAQQQEPAQ